MYDTYQPAGRVDTPVTELVPRMTAAAVTVGWPVMAVQAPLVAGVNVKVLVVGVTLGLIQPEVQVKEFAEVAPPPATVKTTVCDEMEANTAEVRVAVPVQTQLAATWPRVYPVGKARDTVVSAEVEV